MQKRTPTQGVLVAALFAVYIVVYIAIIPPLQGFDSVAHFNYANYLRQQPRWPAINNDTAAYSYEIPQQPPLYYALAAGAAAWLPYERADEITRSSDNPYQMTLSPLWTVDLPDAPASWHVAARIAQWVSALGGLLAVLFTYAWVKLLLPARPRVHAFTTAVVAMNPLFVYLTVTTSNDVWAVAGATALAWSGAWLARNPRARWVAVFAVGCLCGLALLTKYSAGLGALAGVAAYVLLRKPAQPRFNAQRIIAFIAGVLLTAGAWYGTNVLAYGELIPMQQAAAVLPGLHRPAPLSPAALLAEVPGLLTNYWGVFIGTIDAGVYDTTMTLLVALGMLGLLVAATRLRQWTTEERAALLISLVWVMATALSVMWWVRSISFGGHARLLLVASPAVALQLVLGWRQLAQIALPATLRKITQPALLGGLLLLPFLPLPVFLRNYTQPAPVTLNASTMDRVINAGYNEGMVLAGIDLPRGPFIAPGHDMPLRLYLKTDAGVDGYYTLFIHLVDPASGKVLHAFDGVPFGGRHPTRQWRAGEAFADDYAISLPADFNPNVTSTLQLVAGFYPVNQPDQPLIAHDGAGRPLGQVLLTNVRVVTDIFAAATVITATTPLAAWDSGIALTEATLREDDSGVTVQTAWQAQSRLNRDYTLFVHLLDENGQLVAQQDQQPKQGQLPTSLWQAGERIDETIVVQVSADKAAQWTTAVIGLYDPASGERPNWVSGMAESQDDTVVLHRR